MGMDKRNRSAQPAPDYGPARGLIALLALGYTAFAIYGSLVPLDYHPHPLAEAVAAFRDLRYLELGIASRADWVANILLFIPLAFLWLGALWPTRTLAARVVASVAVLVGAALLAAGIEFLQFYFPQRTQSLNDILAENMGALIGVLAWVLLNPRLMPWLGGWSHTRSRSGLAERLLYAYLFVVFGYGVLPLDLTISPVEIFHKWRDGRLFLLPFMSGSGSVAQQAYNLLADMAIWIPAALLWRLAGRASTARVVMRTALWAAALEFLQLFVYSRVTDSTQILTAALGGLLGATLAARLANDSAMAQQARSSGAKRVALLSVAALAWSAVILLAFWYPFDFRSDWGFVHQRIAQINRVPFATYYYGTEFRAVTEVLHKTGFFFPLGAVLALLAFELRRRWPIPPLLLHGIAAMVIAGLAATVEAGQIFLPGKFADATDWLLEGLGGIAGYLALRWLAPRWSNDAPRPPAPRRG